MHVKRSILYHPYAYPVRDRKIMDRTSPTIVYMAYMSRGYGCFKVMEAFKMIANEYPDLTLEMIGRAPEFQEMINWVTSEKLELRIRLRGYVDEEELDSYFSGAICFMSPLRDAITERARCPSKLFYYIPYNRPIITCNIGNPPDVLGRYGYYYEPENVVDMSMAMRRAIRDSDTFNYPVSVVESNTWEARAKELEAWLCKE
jgi:glycosyltransferase involved in cell wall biosynthesis